MATPRIRIADINYFNGCVTERENSYTVVNVFEVTVDGEDYHCLVIWHELDLSLRLMVSKWLQCEGPRWDTNPSTEECVEALLQVALKKPHNVFYSRSLFGEDIDKQTALAIEELNKLLKKEKWPTFSELGDYAAKEFAGHGCELREIWSASPPEE